MPRETDTNAWNAENASDAETQRQINEANLVCACAASVAPSAEWLRGHLQSALGKSGLDVPQRTANAIIADGVAILEGSDLARRAALLAEWHGQRLFEVGGGIVLMQRILSGELGLAGAYDSRVREACMRALGALRLPPRVLYDAEREVASKVLETLSKANAKESTKSEDDELARRKSRARWLKIGGAGVVGGVALGLSGGLLAPALVPALGSVGLTGIAAGMSGASATMAFGGLFGAAGAGLGATAMANRTGAVEEFAFERCVSLRGEQDFGSDGCGEISPKSKILDVSVVVKNDVAKGGLLVWEFFTSQNIPMVVTAGVVFGVIVEDLNNSARSGSGEDVLGSKKTSNNVNWAFKEKVFDAGGLERDGKGKIRRYTDALTVFNDNVKYVFRWRLLQGSMTTDIKYRYALVPPGNDMPVWLMSQDEKETGLLQKTTLTNEARALSCVVFVPGLLPPAASHSAPGVAADQFCAPNGPVANLDEYGIESYALRWETRQLWDLSNALSNLARRVAISSAAQGGARAIAPALVGAFALPLSLVAAIRLAIDNVWATTMSRARSAGHMLATELASRGFGKRPVTLAGYSCGALLLFVALEELARRKLNDIVHDVYLLGAPVSCDGNRWRNVRNVVSGRLVNIYMPDDWYLEIMQRSTAIGGDTFCGVAGTTAVAVVGDEIENHNVVELPLEQKIRHHSEYALYASEIFRKAGLADGEQIRPWPSSHLAWRETDESEVDRPMTHAVSQPVFPSSPLVDIDDPPPSPEVVVFTNKNRRRGRSEPPRKRQPLENSLIDSKE